MIKISNLNCGYDNKIIIDNLSIVFKQKEFYGIIGPNGAGKSTLLKAIVGYIKADKEMISINKKKLCDYSPKELAKIIAIIPQTFNLQFDYKVEELVLMGRYPHLEYWQNYSLKDKEIVEQMLKRLDMFDLKDKHYSELSGGEQQRVAIARALVQESEIILMDESFSHLDLHHQIEIMNLLHEIQRKDNKMIIIISHNINLASEFCSKIVILNEGKLFKEGTPEEVLNQKNIGKIYGQGIHITHNPITGKPNLFYSGLK